MMRPLHSLHFCWVYYSSVMFFFASYVHHCILYWAQAVLVPVALAMLLTFLLSLVAGAVACFASLA